MSGAPFHFVTVNYTPTALNLASQEQEDDAHDNHCQVDFLVAVAAAGGVYIAGPLEFRAAVLCCNQRVYPMSPPQHF